MLSSSQPLDPFFFRWGWECRSVNGYKVERQGSPKSSQNTSNGEARDGMQGELTVHELCAYRDAVLHKKGTEESDDVRRVALQSRQEAV